MKKFFLFLIIVAGITSAVFFYLNKQQIKTIALLEKKISFLKAVNTPVKFVVTERTDSVIKFSIKFLDQNGKEVGRQNMEMKGSELNFDFRVIKVGERFLAFPSKIFTDAIAPEKGIELYKYYSDAGFPAIFTSENTDTDVKQALAELFTKLQQNTDKNLESEFGSVVHDLKGIKTFEKDLIYQIIVHTKGGIEILKD